MYHTSIGFSPYICFYGAHSSDIDDMHIFRQLGHCPNKKHKPKLVPKAKVVRYLHRIQPNHIFVEIEDGSTQSIRASEFEVCDPFKDPRVTTTGTFHNTDDRRFASVLYTANLSKAHLFLTDVANAHDAASTANMQTFQPLSHRQHSRKKTIHKLAYTPMLTNG